MNKTKRFVKAISPYFQQIYAEAIRLFESSRSRRDIDGMVRAFRMLYDAAVVEVKDQVDRLAKRFAREAGVETDGLFNAKQIAEEIVDHVCANIYSQYREFVSVQDKFNTCFKLGARALELLFDKTIRLIDEHGGLFHAQVLAYGGLVFEEE